MNGNKNLPNHPNQQVVVVRQTQTQMFSGPLPPLGSYDACVLST